MCIIIDDNTIWKQHWMRFSLLVLIMLVLLLGCADSELPPLIPGADESLAVGSKLAFEDGHFIALRNARDELDRVAMMGHVPTLDMFHVEVPDDFFTVNVTLCAGDAPITLDPSTITVMDNESRQSSPNAEQEQAPALVETDVAPNECKSGWVSYYLPEGVTARTLIYDAPGYAAVEFDLSDVLDFPSDSVTLEALFPDVELMTSILEDSELTMSTEFHGLTARELVSLQISGGTESDVTDLDWTSRLHVIGLKEVHDLDSVSFARYEGSHDALFVEAVRFGSGFGSRMYYEAYHTTDSTSSMDIQPISVIDARYSERTDGETRVAVLEAHYFTDVWTIALISSDREDQADILEQLVISIVRRYGGG
jgi:hypothetical protein